MGCFILFISVLILSSAVPIAYVVHRETSERATHAFEYHSCGWFHETTQWDDIGRRFIVSSFDGGLGVIPVPDDESGTVLEEIHVVNNVGFGKNSSLGLTIDRPRNRVLVVISDVLGYRFGALAACDLTTWNRLFLTQLSGSDAKALANDVAVDGEGNAYVTDSIGSKIWKVGVNGEFLQTIYSPLFTSDRWYENLIAVNGIVFHPNGYLLVDHTTSGNLFKIEIGDGHRVSVVNVTGGGSLRFGDGMALLSPTRLVVAGNPSKLVESSDDWETAQVVGKFYGITHRLVTSALVKDGKVYVSHLLGMGYPKRKHLLLEAVF